MDNLTGNTRHLTKRQVNFFIVLMFTIFPIIYFVLGSYNLEKDILFYEYLNAAYEILKLILLYLSFISYILITLTFIKWLIRNKAHKGLRYALKHYSAQKKIRKMFLDSNYFLNRVYLGREVSEPLNIKLKFFENGQAELKIENHLNFDSKLDGARINSALGNYVVEVDYETNDSNYYVYDLLDAEMMHKQNEFEEFEDYEKWCKTDVTDYELKIDDRLTTKFGHYLIVGKTGSGKTYALYHLLFQVMMKSKGKRAEIHYCDPKSSSLLAVGKILSPDTTPVPTVEEPDNFEAIKDEIEKVYNILIERQNELLPKLEQNKLDADYSDFGMKPIILLVDEWAAFSKRLSSETKKQEPRNIVSMTSEIILKGRQLGVFFWSVMQQANAKVIDTDIRENMMLKTVLGNSGRITYDTAFSSSEASGISNVKRNPGTGVYQYDGAEDTNIRLLAFPFLKFDILKEFKRLGVK